MERIKQSLSRAAKAAYQVACSRRFAAALLAVATVAMSVTVSVNSRAITVTDGDESHVVLTMHDDPYEVLDNVGVVLEEHDTIDISKQSTIDINRAMAVEVQADGLSTLLHLTEGTVADALARAGITLGTADKINIPTATPLEDGMCVEIDRIAYQDYTVTEAISYETTTKYTACLNPGAVRVQQYGQNGERTITFRRTIVNGKVTETNQVGVKVTKQPVRRVQLVGSSYGTPMSKAPFAIQLNSKNQPVNYKKVYTNKSCTAYSIGTYGASGMRLGVGTVAVDPRQIPYGTKLWITSADGKFVYGYAIAADTGSFAGGPTFADLYFGSYTEACHFGRRNLNIYVIG